MMKILVTGGNSQLALTLKTIINDENEIKYFNKNELDITISKTTEKIIRKYNPKYIINTAAYTNVELAEKNNKKAIDVNAYGVFKLAKIAKKYDITLIHFSTDYIFNGLKKSPYKIKDKAIPLNEYGKSKFFGEQLLNSKIQTNCLILRVSWLYSQFPNNFLSYLIKKIIEGQDLMMVNDLKSIPTSTYNLCLFLKNIVDKNLVFKKKNLTLHFCDSGKPITPYEFSKYTLKMLNKIKSYKNKIKSVSINDFKSNVYRPIYSSLDNKESILYMKLQPLHWQKEIKRIINLMEI